jgi:hypothetical protein
LNRSELIAAYRQARSEWLGLLGQLDPAQMLHPLDDSGWSVKDIIAHLTWHEREMIQVAQQRALVGSPWWSLPTGQRNTNIYELFKDRSLEGVMDSAEIISAELIQALAQLSDADMLDSACFKEMPSDWQPWRVFASNMHEHYQEHLQDLKGRFGQQARDS